ncbi:DNA-binding response regulator [Paenibacillus selenitireducens]|uniref:DNA-binding response regulator n=1 Tax=Paenibacillus selenitireducens TaxID=1324314 RepID=A0A1T2XH04_9BACL|nr:helix-turn-helix domain-containing protein [Paenibacillus selenitireducens]OPA79095.1 DNA-binding response regulator [Paenibacillus selenitireducens]
MLHVHIVEPHTDKRARIKEMVQALGHIVVGEACDREEALRLMEQGWPTLLLTDLMLPRLEGLALVSHVHEQRIPVVTIILSDSTCFDDVRQSMQAGAIDYLLKPVKNEELRRALQRAEERVVYFHGAHREFVLAQQFFERLDLLQPAEFIQRHAEMIRSMQSFEEGQPGERLGLFRLLSAKWHHFLKQRGLVYDEPFLWEGEGEAISYFQRLGEFWIAQSASPADSSVKLNVKRACDYIRENYQSDHTLAEVCGRFGMSVSYFSVQFKKYTGYSFVNYLNRVRIEKAKELLLQSNLKIYEVAGEVGYDTLQYFNRVFKQAVHMTPGEYRSRLGI